MKQRTFFSESEKLNKLSKLGDPLEEINKHIDWSIFVDILNKSLQKEDKGVGGRPAYEYILLFKILILQQQYNLSDDKMEYMINDRISFQRFLGLDMDSTIPDATTIWTFREKLTQKGQIKELFDKFNQQLEEQGYILRDGSIVDSTIVQKPRKHTDSYDDGAGWTKKGDQTYYGYKDHVKVDKSSKIIVSCKVTAANISDNREIAGLIDERDQEIYADKVYAGKNIEAAIQEKNATVKINIHKKGRRGHPLTEEEKAENAKKTPIRVRVEHVFGHMKQAMNGTYARCKTLSRATTWIMLKNLAYNINRAAFLRDKRVITA